MSKSDLPKLVTALFTFKGKNNDELCFKKGDLIIITQTDDGGWWEGTLNDKTGWFPSNYVKEYKSPESGHSSTKSSPEKTNQELPVYQRVNRDIVLRDLVDSEKANIAELQSFVDTYLEQLELSNILKKEEYKQLAGNIHEVLETHQRFLTNLEATVAQGPDSKVGNLFLSIAPKFKSVHMAYCNGHPQAVCILDKYRDELNEFMEHNGSATPGILVLTSGLSKPFRRLEKYAHMLQELERYTGKNHSDRGDTQRSVSVYREIAERCTSIRKQKELALQILTSGIKGWEGEELTSLGEILYVGPVTVLVGAERRDRYFVLFPTNLLVLSTSSRMSSFIYEGKLPITGINVIPIDDTEDMKNIFEISGPMIESIVVLCAHKEERCHWIELLTQDQSSNLLKSPTMSHVSYTNSPYTRLSRFYAKLIRKKIIHPELVKKLLYLQYSYKPDLSAVKMRKCKVSYTIYPTQSDEYSTDGDSEKISEKSPIRNEKPRALLKSSLMLDVRYTVKPNNVSNLETNLSFSGSLASVGNYETKHRNHKQSKFDTCQSLPNKFLSYKSESSLSYLNNSDNDRELKYLNSSSKTWKSIETKRKVDCASPEFIYFDHLPSQLTGVTENSFNTNASSSHLLPITSVYSSDSGMADSYHMASTELTSSYKYYSSRPNKCDDKVQISCHESENDEHNFEHQCICSSPFGSTPRRSEQSGQYSESIDDNIADYTALRINENADSFIECMNSEKGNNDKASKNDKNNIVSCKNLDNNKRYTVPMQFDCKNIRKKDKRLVDQPEIIGVEGKKSEKPVFTSGLYAHWWLKKAIPISENTNQDEPSINRETSKTTPGILFVTKD